jgi:hypothetical protein
VNFPLVKLSPSKALGLIANTWGTIDLEGDVLYDQLSQGFGTATVTQPLNPTNIL